MYVARLSVSVVRVLCPPASLSFCVCVCARARARTLTALCLRACAVAVLQVSMFDDPFDEALGLSSSKLIGRKVSECALRTLCHTRLTSSHI